MTAHRTARTASAGRVVKSPLAVHDDLGPAADADQPDRRPADLPSPDLSSGVVGWAACLT
jgi:hypothetical protein